MGQSAHRFFLRTENPERSGLDRVDLNARVGPQASAPQPVVLSFASFECTPCKKELAALTDRQEELDDLGALFAVVVMDPDADLEEQMVTFLVQELNVPFPVMRDPGQIIARYYGVKSLPHTVVVSTNGDIQWISNGYSGPESLDALFEAIAKAH